MKKLIKIERNLLIFFFASFQIATPMPKASDTPKSTSNIAATPTISLTKQPQPAIIANNNPTSQPAQQPQQEVLDEIKKIMENINSLKDELKHKLKELDEKLDEARKAAVEGKKISFEILHQDSQRSARDTFDKVKDKLQQMKNVQTFVQSSFTKEFNQKIAEFNALTAKLQSKKEAIAKLQPKQAGKLATPLPEAKATPVQTSQNSPAQQTTSSTSKGGESTFLHSITQTASDITAQAISWIRKTKNWLLEAGQPTEEKKTKNATVTSPSTPVPPPAKLAEKPTLPTAMPTSKSPATTTPPQQTMPTSSMPTSSNKTESLPQTPPNIASTITVNNQHIQEQLASFDSLVKTLDGIRLQLNERYQDVKKNQKTLYTFLSQYPQLQEAAHAKGLHDSATAKKWKNAFITIAGKLFDAAAWSIGKTIELTQHGYNKFVRPLLNKFTKDVQEKVKIIEEKQKKAV